MKYATTRTWRLRFATPSRKSSMSIKRGARKDTNVCHNSFPTLSPRLSKLIRLLHNTLNSSAPRRLSFPLQSNWNLGVLLNSFFRSETAVHIYFTSIKKALKSYRTWSSIDDEVRSLSFSYSREREDRQIRWILSSATYQEICLLYWCFQLAVSLFEKFCARDNINQIFLKFKKIWSFH